MGPSKVSRVNRARGVVLSLTYGCLHAQSLLLPPSMVTHGTSGSLLLSLQSPSGKAPVALQWEFTFPSNVVVDLADIVAGSAAESAEKSLTCRAVEQKNGAGQGSLYGCILAGGQKPIPNGPVATVRYRVPSETRQIAEKIRVGKVIGVSADLKRIEIQDLQAAIVVK
jgi:hypothetical protein